MGVIQRLQDGCRIVSTQHVAVARVLVEQHGFGGWLRGNGKPWVNPALRRVFHFRASGVNASMASNAVISVKGNVVLRMGVLGFDCGRILCRVRRGMPGTEAGGFTHCGKKRRLPGNESGRSPGGNA